MEEALTPAQQLEALRAAIEDLRRTSDNDLHQVAAELGAGLAKVEKQFARAGKELFKANARTVEMELLLKHAETAEAQAAEARAQLLETHIEARHILGDDLAKVLLPALDGLDEALASGEALINQARPPGFWAKLRFWITRSGNTSPKKMASVIPSDSAKGWLEGAAVVRGRLLDSLMEYGVTRIDTVQQPFDPHFHHAVETVFAAGYAPGTIIEERRAGYRMGDKVLRYADVVAVKGDERQVPGSG